MARRLQIFMKAGQGRGVSRKSHVRVGDTPGRMETHLAIRIASFVFVNFTEHCRQLIEIAVYNITDNIILYSNSTHRQIDPR